MRIVYIIIVVKLATYNHPLCIPRITTLGTLFILCRNPTMKVCEDEIRIPEIGTWGSFEIPEISEFDFRGLNTSHWSVIYIIGKLSKC